MRDLIKKMPPVVARFLNAKYEFGAQGPDAYDCVSFIYHFYKALGFNIPAEFNELNAGNYTQKYMEDPKRGAVIMRQYLRSLTEKVDPHSMSYGDLVLLKGFVTIYIGSGNHICVHTPLGVIVAPGHALDLSDMEVRRLCHRS